MSRLSVQMSTKAIPQLLQDPQVKENFRKLSVALMSGISYEYVSHLVPPTLLSQQSGSYKFPIKLRVAEADELARGREKKEAHDSGSEQIHYNSRVLIRMCILEGGHMKIDCFPSNMSVRVNGVFYVRIDQEGPIDITPHVKLCPDVENLVIIDQPSPVGLHVLAIIIVKALNCSSMVRNLIENRTRPESITRERIKQYHEVLNGSDVSVMSTEFSLTCPLSQKRLAVPAQGENCNHLACFDLHVYLKINTHKGKWLCPVCNNKVLPPQLIVDGYWKNVLAQSPWEDITSVLLDSRGDWTPKHSDSNPSSTLNDTVNLKVEEEITYVDLTATSD